MTTNWFGIWFVYIQNPSIWFDIWFVLKICLWTVGEKQFTLFSPCFTRCLEFVKESRFLSKITWIMVHGSAKSLTIFTLSWVFLYVWIFDPIMEPGNYFAHYLVRTFIWYKWRPLHLTWTLNWLQNLNQDIWETPWFGKHWNWAQIFDLNFSLIWTKITDLTFDLVQKVNFEQA